MLEAGSSSKYVQSTKILRYYIDILPNVIVLLVAQTRVNVADIILFTLNTIFPFNLVKQTILTTEENM